MSEYRQLADAEERSQARARLAISALVVAILGTQVVTGHRPWGGGLDTAILAVGSYWVFALGWYVYVSRVPDRHLGRRYVTVVTDMAMTTVAMGLAGERASYFYPVYLWVIVGYGLRFGRSHLLAGVACGVLGFGSLLAFNEFWSLHRNIGYGLLAGVVILPLFYLTIMRRLRDMNVRMEKELARSKAAERAKGEFLANMSHEIRTPMNGILGMVQVLEDARLEPADREHVELIGRSGEALLAIINDILDYSKIASGKLTVEEVPFDLREILVDVHRLLQPTADDKNIGFDLVWPADAPSAYVGDPVRLRQIVFNLAGNAIKFTEQGTVTMNCRTVPRADGRHQVVLEVADTGAGIPADRLEAIFERFEQADAATTRRHGGTGLGLAICRQLAGLMGGSVRARSTVGEGSVFTLELPLATCEAPAARVRRTVHELPHFGLRALVAEDNTMSRYVAEKLLQKVGIKPAFAATGHEAVELAHSADFDLVLMDVRMPEMDGFEATARIRALAGDSGRVPIVALTADATSGDSGRCLAAGMDAYLCKPLRTEDLIAVVEGLGLAAREAVKV